jgi:hypothetical protein
MNKIRLAKIYLIIKIPGAGLRCPGRRLAGAINDKFVSQPGERGMSHGE